MKTLTSKFNDMNNDIDLHIKKGLHAILMSANGIMKSLYLPANITNGRYRFDSDFNSEISNMVYIEPKENKWFACCNKPAYFNFENRQTKYSVELTENNLYEIICGENEYILHIEDAIISGLRFNYYVPTQNSVIHIGRADNNDIVYVNKLMSRIHASLEYNGNNWIIKDLGSTNGIFVNGKKSKYVELVVGDYVYILGLRIIIGAGYIAINDGSVKININTDKIKLIENPQFSLRFEKPLNHPKVQTLFNRLPRHRIAMDNKDIIIEAPPVSLSSNSIPLLLRMGGSMTMGATSAISGNYTMLLSSVLFPILGQKYSDRERKIYEKNRLEKYREYLEEKKSEIISEKGYEEEILRRNYPELIQVFKNSHKNNHLWDHRKTDDDFLNIRIGYGELPLISEMKYPEKRFSMEKDVLEDEMYSLIDEKVTLENAPIMIDFIDNFVCSAVGGKELIYDFLQTLILRCSLLYSYDEVKMIFLLDKEDLKFLEYIKYIPHTWDDQKTIRFIATDAKEACQLSEYIQIQMEQDIKKPRNMKDILKDHPYYMVFALSKRVLDSLEILKEIMQQEKSCGLSILTTFEDLPKECMVLFDLQDTGKHLVKRLNQIESNDNIFLLDRFDRSVAMNSMSIISNTSLRIISQAYSLPNSVTFLEIFGVGKIEHLNPLKYWNDNNPVKTLSTPIGIATDGSIFTLDLHQKYQGPHGLVAGMTGSGKSEFLITYILSMAVNYHPYEVAFILIDYKGGGLTGAFNNEETGVSLPHIIGTITNLDGSTIQRSLMSIQSELLRRQRIFNKVKNLTEEGTVDIYLYQKLYRNKVVNEPLPHLFIISDEFAELKQQQPEFMDRLISIARIGRSLGVHLILATQKPAGVVNDQIRSNTKFRVCLKVQDKMDSMDMLKRPEAAELKDTGRFYLQVGYNEFFALGQSAWSGAPYEPQDTIIEKRDTGITFIDNNGQSILTVKSKSKKGNSQGSQLVTIVKMLSDIAKENMITPKLLWEEPLPKKLDLKYIEDNYNTDNSLCSTAIGIVDDPENQKQIPLILDYEGCKNMLIVGEQGSGKTTVMQTMLISIIKKYSPEDVNFYILDYSSRMMKLFKDLPHCGIVLGEEDESDLDAFFDLINSIILERKKLFSELEVDNYKTANSIRHIPLILIFIDNISWLNGSKQGYNHYTKLHDYMKNGANFGIRYIISCNNTSETNIRIRQMVGDRIALHLKDRYEFGDALECRCTYLPPVGCGRGLCKINERPLEMQIAKFKVHESKNNYIQELKKYIVEISEKYNSSYVAKRLPTIPNTETYEEFVKHFGTGRIPLGYSMSDAKPVAIPFRQLSKLSVYIGNPMGIKPIIGNFLYTAKREQMDIIVIKRTMSSCFDDLSIKHLNENYDSICFLDVSKDNLVKLWNEPDYDNSILQECINRKKIFVDYCKENSLNPSDSDTYGKTFEYITKNTKPMLVLCEAFSEICKVANEATVKVFEKIFEIAKQLNIYFIGCFYPEDQNNLFANTLYKSFIADNLCMLFGGRLMDQSICNLPAQYKTSNNKGIYNRCLMYYRDQFYPLLMPCGQLVVETKDEDELSIF